MILLLELHVYWNSLDENGRTLKNKARVVAPGYNQK